MSLSRKFQVVILFCLILGCGRQPPPAELKSPPLPEVKRLPVAYLLMVDNSASIPAGEPRFFAKEAIKAFIELAETGDRISLMAFDKDARILASRTLRSQEDRDILNRAAEEGLTFTGQATDIGSAFTLLRARQNEIFTNQGYTPAVILISDGKLEPERRIPVQQAYDTIFTVFRELPAIPFYTIGLGDRDIHDQFLPGMTGLVLLRDKLSQPSGGRFFHTKKVDDLIDTCFMILQLTKGVTESKDVNVFWVDDSTVRLSALVLKRTTASDLCSTQEIYLETPQGQKITSVNYAGFAQAASAIRWQIGRYYDLITLTKPHVGIWKIKLITGKEPHIVSIVNQLVILRSQVRRYYWDKEKKIPLAWLFDERTNALSEAPYQVAGKLGSESDFTVPFQRASNGIFLGHLKKLTPGEYSIRIRGVQEARFFYRITPSISFTVKKAYFDVKAPEGRITAWDSGLFKVRRMLGWQEPAFELEMDTRSANYIPFQVDPEVILHLEKVPKQGKPQGLPGQTLSRQAADGKHFYSFTQVIKGLPLGCYRGNLTIKGILGTGEQVDLATEDFYFCLERGWADVVEFILLVLALLWVILWMLRPRLKGSLQVKEPPERRKNISLGSHKRRKKLSIIGESLAFGKTGKELVQLHNIAFNISARRFKKILCTLAAGSITLWRGEMSHPLVLKRGEPLYNQDELRFTDNGKDYLIKLILPIQAPRTRPAPRRAQRR